MDCLNARALLGFMRTGELEPPERDALEKHLAGCPECEAFCRAEGRFDDALELAMPRISVPAGLKGRILARLARAPRPGRRWRWAAAAAALLAASVSIYLALAGWPREIDDRALVAKVDLKTAQEVEAAFEHWGVAMTAPREFNFDLLDAVDVAEIQGRRVAKLTFFSQGDGRGALAHVYVLAADQFTLPTPQQDAGLLGELVIPASTHNIQILRYGNVPDFFFMVISTSRSLDPFLLRGT